MLLNILFWTSAVAVWHHHHRPVVGTLEVHGHLAFPGGYSAVVLFELSVTRLPSDDGQSEGGSLPSTHSVFGTSEEVEVEVEVEVEDEAGEEFGEVVESELEEHVEAKMKHFEARMKHFQTKMKRFEAKMKHFEANMKHFEAKMKQFEAKMPPF